MSLGSEGEPQELDGAGNIWTLPVYPDRAEKGVSGIHLVDPRDGNMVRDKQASMAGVNV